MKLSEHNYFSEKIIKVKRINNAQRSKDAVREKITSVLKAYSVSKKKTPLKEMCDFLTLKMLPLALVLIKTKESFIPIGHKMLMRNLNFE